MSKYTTEVRFICEQYAGLDHSVDGNAVNEVIENARSHIFDFDYPIFDSNYKAVLETKILKHYYTREIGAETVGLWKLWLDTKMNEIMPYYNQLYLSATLEFNPLYDVDLTTTHQKVDNGSHSKSGTSSDSESKTGSDDIAVSRAEHGASSGSNSNTVTRTNSDKNDHWEMFSDTPQGGLTGVENENYLTTALHTTDDKTGSTSGETGSGQNSGTYDGTDNSSTDRDYSESIAKSGQSSESGTVRNVQDYSERVLGKTAGASYSKMLAEFRETFLNIDMMVIDELRDLFMTVW